MKLDIKDSSAALAKTGLCCVFVLEGKRPTLPAGVKLPTGAAKAFSGGFRKTDLRDAAGGSAARVLLVGLGAAKDVDAERLRRAAALATKCALALEVPSFSIWIAPDLAGPAGPADLARDARATGVSLAEGALMASYSYQAAKSKAARKASATKTCVLAGPGAKFRAGAKRGAGLAAGNALARDLANAPANFLRPKDLAAEARKLARGAARISCQVLSEAQMAKLGMGLLLGVSRGSVEPAQLIHLVYKPKGKSRGRVAFVGKGLTFDSGGISLKPGAKMDEMKYDMCGSAAVLGVFRTLQDLDVPFEVHGLVGAVENMPGGKATKPGDVHTGMDGTTVEILNTDAEGRLVLADVLTYTIRKVKPDTVIDLATLTGAVIAALGHEHTGLFANTDDLRDALVTAGETSGELCWPLPLGEVHKEQVKGSVGDLKNLNGAGQGAGSTAGAAFLAHFVGDDQEWAHLDIAGTAWGARDRDYVGGPLGSGVGVRLLMQFLEDRA